jgi:hypothetical protein
MLEWLTTAAVLIGLLYHAKLALTLGTKRPFDYRRVTLISSAIVAGIAISGYIEVGRWPSAGESVFVGVLWFMYVIVSSYGYVTSVPTVRHVSPIT